MTVWNACRLAYAFVAGLVLAPLAASAQDRLTIGLPVKTVSFAPLFHAVDSGAFKKRGIEMNIVVLTGGAPVISAVLAGDAQFASLANDELLKIADSERLIRIHSFSNSFTQNLQVRAALLTERGVTNAMPVTERIRRLKGMTMGVLQLGGSSDIAGRWLFREAGLDPANDLKLLRVGGLPALVASMREGTIDGFVLSPPAGQIVEAQGIGRITVRYDEVPQWADEPFLGIETRRDWLAANKGVARRVVEAVAESQKQIYDDPKSASAMLAKASYTGTEQGLIEASLTQMRHAYRAERMSAARWAHVSKMRISLGLKDAVNIEMKEGVHWTNEYFPGGNVPADKPAAPR